MQWLSFPHHGNIECSNSVLSIIEMGSVVAKFVLDIMGMCAVVQC